MLKLIYFYYNLQLIEVKFVILYNFSIYFEFKSILQNYSTNILIFNIYKMCI